MVKIFEISNTILSVLLLFQQYLQFWSNDPRRIHRSSLQYTNSPSVLIRCAIKRYQNIPGGLYQIFQFFSNKVIGKVRVVVFVVVT